MRLLSARLAGLVLVALAVPGAVHASRLDEIGDRLQRLGRTLADAFHRACRDGGLGNADPHAADLLVEMRETAAARDRLKERCQTAHLAWSRAAARLDETRDFAEVERLQGELLPCWDETERMDERIEAEVRRCLERRRAGRAPIFPFGLTEVDTRADLASAVSCPRRDLCELRPESLTSRDPAWLGPGARRLVLGFLDVEAEQVLTSILAVFDFPHCFAARDRVEDWARRIEESWPEVIWQGALGSGCRGGSRVAAIGDHVVILLLAEKEDGRGLAAVLVVHLPWRILREPRFPTEPARGR